MFTISVIKILSALVLKLVASSKAEDGTCANTYMSPCFGPKMIQTKVYGYSTISEPEKVELNTSSLPLVSKIASGLTRKIRGIWAWGSDTVATPQARQALKQFVVAPHGQTQNSFTHVWLNAYSALKYPDRWHELRSMISMLHDGNIKVEFLDGDKSWVSTVEGEYDRGIEHCRRFETFQSQTRSTHEKFDGLHLDVEPWGLDEWNSTVDGFSPDLQQTYMDFIRECSTIARLPVAADIPFWWYKASTFDDMMNSTGIFSYLSVMNYRRSRDWADSAIESMLQKSNGRKQLVFGVETSPRVVETESYARRGYDAVFDDNAFFMNKYTDRVGFKGVAVHHYASFKDQQAEPL